MLHKRMINETVLEVLDTEVTFGGLKRQYRYYDVVNWNELSNRRLTRQKNPTKVNFKMSDKLISWVKSFYLTSLEKEQYTNASLKGFS